MSIIAIHLAFLHVGDCIVISHAESKIEGFSLLFLNSQLNSWLAHYKNVILISNFTNLLNLINKCKKY